MKRILSVLLAAVLLCGAFVLGASAADPIDITAAFTDENFREAVRSAIRKYEPAPIYDTDVEGLTFLQADYANIECLDGLEYLTGLTAIICSNNPLKELPASLPSGLIYLTCANNQLTTLPTLPSGLLGLSCGGNQLTSLPDLPLGLEFLWCFDNQLTYLGSYEKPATQESLEKRHLMC